MDCGDWRRHGGVVGEDFGGEAGYDAAVAVDEELFEVPEDFGWVGWGEILGLEVVGDVFAEGIPVGRWRLWAGRR